MEKFTDSIGIWIVAIIITIIGEIIKSLSANKKKPSPSNTNEHNEIHEYSQNAESNRRLKNDSKQEVHRSRKKFMDVMENIVDSVSCEMEMLEGTYKPSRTNHGEFSNEDITMLGEINYDDKGPIKTQSAMNIDSIKDEEHYSSEVYHRVSEIKDIDHDVYNHVAIATNINKTELRKAIIMKEVLDKPVAYRKIRR